MYSCIAEVATDVHECIDDTDVRERPFFSLRADVMSAFEHKKRMFLCSAGSSVSILAQLLQERENMKKL